MQSRAIILYTIAWAVLTDANVNDVLLSFSCSLSLPLSLMHTHTHTHTQIDTDMFTPIHSSLSLPFLFDSYSLVHRSKHMLASSLSLSLSLSFSPFLFSLYSLLS